MTNTQPPENGHTQPDAGRAPELAQATGSASEDLDFLTICVARDMIAKLKADNAHLRERFGWWMANAEAIAKERGELFTAGEAMRSVIVGHAWDGDEVGAWDAAAQPLRDMFAAWSSPNNAHEPRPTDRRTDDER